MKKLKMKKCISVAVGLMATALLTPSVNAADYPSHPVSVVVPFKAGGSTDLLARAFVHEMEQLTGDKFGVKNIHGGAGTVGTAYVARSRADGYTIGFLPAAPLTSQPHRRDTPYSIDDFTYICQVFFSPMALAVGPDSQFRNLNDVVKYAKANPGKLSYGSPGPASLPHLAMESFLLETGVDIKHVPVGGDAGGLTNLLGGHIDFYMAVIPTVAKNQLDAVALFSEKRVDNAPDLATSVEQGFKTTASWWGGVFAPKGISAQVKSILEKGCASVTASAGFVETLDKLSTRVQYRNSEDVRALVNSDSKVNKQIIAEVLGN